MNRHRLSSSRSGSDPSYTHHVPHFAAGWFYQAIACEGGPYLRWLHARILEHTGRATVLHTPHPLNTLQQAFDPQVLASLLRSEFMSYTIYAYKYSVVPCVPAVWLGGRVVWYAVHMFRAALVITLKLQPTTSRCRRPGGKRRSLSHKAALRWPQLRCWRQLQPHRSHQAAL
jgi:hypothetical protein